MSSREGVEIDFCPQCRGVWLDRGELAKIVDRAAASIGSGGAPVTEMGYAEPLRPELHDDRSLDGHSRHHRTRQRRSFLEDLFHVD